MKFILSVMSRKPDAGGNVRHIGDFDRLEDAIAATKQVVDEVLNRVYTAGMTSAQVLEKYRAEAATPIISRDDEGTMNASSFNHFQYAKMRSEELCGGI